MKFNVMLFNLFLVLLLLCAPSAGAQNAGQDFSDEFISINEAVYQDRKRYEQEAKATADAKGEEIMDELNETIKENEKESLNAYARTSNTADENGEAYWYTEYSLRKANERAEVKKAMREDEHRHLTNAARAMTDVEEETFDSMAHLQLAKNYGESLVSPYVLEYETDEVERLLEQKDDLMRGYVSSDLEALEFDETYGFGSAEITSKISAVESQGAQGISTHETEADRLEMAAQEAENLLLMADGVVAKENNVRGLVQDSEAIAANGGVELFLDELTEEVQERLLELDLKIIKILTKESYEQDEQTYDNDLIHPITGAVLKGYARRKALREISGCMYAQAEDMRQKNRNGEVIDNNEIISLLERLYPGYSYYEY